MVKDIGQNVRAGSPVDGSLFMTINPLVYISPSGYLGNLWRTKNVAVRLTAGPGPGPGPLASGSEGGYPVNALTNALTV